MLWDDYLVAILFSIVYGWVEMRIYQRGFRTQRTIFNHFGIYHVGMLALFILAAYPLVKLLPLMIMIEDAAFFYFHPDKELTKKSWVNWKLGGFKLWGQWIPTIYVLLFVLYIVLEIIF